MSKQESTLVITRLSDLKETPPVVKVTNKGVELKTDTRGYSYILAWTQLDTKPKLLKWARHLANKTWFTTAHLRELLDAASVRFPIDLYHTDD